MPDLNRYKNENREKYHILVKEHADMRDKGEIVD